MVARGGQNLCTAQRRKMSSNKSTAINSIPPPEMPLAPVRTRVRLRRINCNHSRPYPPDGREKVWWEQLKKALGTTSSDFVNATLLQIQGASRMPGGGISETSVNAVLALIEGAAPKNEVEGALAVQMACTHAVTMAVLSSLGGAHGSERNTNMKATAAARLARAFTMQLEALRRLRNGSSQLVRVEHVHVHEGGQAAIGNFRPPGD
jgi:hypothetical protein